VALAREGIAVRVFEASEVLGGGTQSRELALPGFTHDVCSAVHPLAASSPFFSELPLAEHGLDWVHAGIPLAHPLDDGTAVALHRSIAATAESLGGDGPSYRKLLEPCVSGWQDLADDILNFRLLPRNPLSVARFAWYASRSAKGLVQHYGWTTRAAALFAGLAGHSILPLDRSPSAAFGLVLAAAGHAVGWPFPRGGASRIPSALVSHLKQLGGEVIASSPVRSLDELRDAQIVLCDITPRQLLLLAGDKLPPRYRSRLQQYRYGPAAYKIDWALRHPIPWRAQECTTAGTIHVGGTFEEIAESERLVCLGGLPQRPFVLVSQPTLFDPSRAPAGAHTAWGYCHVPNGCDADMTSRIEDQVERFAPGFRDTILARSVMRPSDFEKHNPNLVGGDISGGANDWRQLLLRPTLHRHATPVPGLYLCSAATPPGGGVHGMCGYLAAQDALRSVRMTHRSTI
jgi:phytoene dehydrogenase-like protein